MRSIISRTENGQFVSYPEGIDEFVENVVHELCEKYQTVDLFDLEFCFHRKFAFAMSTELLRENEKY